MSGARDGIGLRALARAFDRLMDWNTPFDSLYSALVRKIEGVHTVLLVLLSGYYKVKRITNFYNSEVNEFS